MNEKKVSPQMQAIYELLYQRKRNQAIQAYSRYSMISREKAEEFIDRLEIELYRMNPELFSNDIHWRSVGYKCIVSFVIVAVLVLLAVAVRMLLKH